MNIEAKRLSVEESFMLVIIPINAEEMSKIV